MRVGAFELIEPVPQLNEPHALAIIPSWMDAGNSASLSLSFLEQTFEAQEMAKLARPGEFFDFTRCRPTLSIKDGVTEIALTNALITYGKRSEGCDFIFLRLPEPNAMAEVYVDSVIEIFKTFGVKRYCLMGSVYDMIPYTRPLLVTGFASNVGLQNSLSDAKVSTSNYEGPSSILYLIGQQALQLSIETLNMVVHLPGYLTPEEDFRGVIKLMEVIGSLYGLEVPQENIVKAREQEEQFKVMAEQFIEQMPHLKVMLKQLEENYDARVKEGKQEIRLSPEVENFLKEMNGRFEKG
jgi:predicted ATP-grasp superfamily ATP-dependent carboligase